MAKMFYSMEETKAALGRNEEGIKQLSREGRLREFRDGQKLMFKADQVETLKAELAGASAEISLAPAEPEIPAPQESAGGIPLAADTHSAAPAAPAASPEDDLLALAGGTNAPGASAAGLTGMGGPGASTSGTSAGSRGGITIFDVDDSQRVDPSAQTAINSSPSAEQIASIESVGSGSGLLDLTRESEDTSLGAVFDEMPAGKSAAGAPGRSAVGFDAKPEPVIEKSRPMPSIAPPTYVEAPDPIGAGIGAAALAAVLCVGFSLAILGGALLGYKPGFISFFCESFMNLLYLVGGGLILAFIFFVAGYFVANTARK